MLSAGKYSPLIDEESIGQIGVLLLVEI